VKRGHRGERGHGGFERAGADVSGSRAGRRSTEGASHRVYRGHGERERGHGSLIEYHPLFLKAREPLILMETK